MASRELLLSHNVPNNTSSMTVILQLTALLNVEWMTVTGEPRGRCKKFRYCTVQSFLVETEKNIYNERLGL